LAERLRSNIPRRRNASAGVSKGDLKGIARQYDALARAQYIAGFLGDPVSVVRNPESYLKKTPQRLLQMGGDEDTIRKWTGKRNLDFLGQAANSIYDRLGGTDFGGANAEDVLTALVTGISPITGGDLNNGKPMPYVMGVASASAGVLYPVGSTAGELGKRGKQLANGLARSRPAERDNVSGDEPTGDTDGGARSTLFDQLSNELEDPETLGDLLFESGNIAKIGPIVSRCLRNDRMKEIWQLVSEDPNLLTVKGNGDLSIRRLDVVQAYLERFGKTIDPNSLGRTWKKNLSDLEGCIKEAFTDEDLVGELNFQRDLAWVLHEERKRKATQKPCRSNNREISSLTKLANTFASFRYSGGITLEVRSGMDKEVLIDFFEGEGVNVKSNRGGEITLIGLNRNSLIAASLLSQAHRLAKFEEV